VAGTIGPPDAMTTPTPHEYQDPRYRDAFAGRRVLITGGAGFIGSHLAHALTGLGAHVRVLDDLSGGRRDNLPPGVELVVASILDDRALRGAAAGCDLVYHQAAMVSVPQSVEQPDECVKVNVLGTERVLAAARAGGARRVLFAASAAAYGNSPSLPSRETDLPDCWSPYAMSKVAGEMLLRAAARNHGMSTVSLRYFNIFGPRQNPDSPYAAVISAFLKALRAGRRPRVLGDGLQTRDFTHVSNVVHANLLAAASPAPLGGEVVNIGTGARIDLLTVLGHLGRVLGRDATPEHGPPRAGDVRHSCADVSLARALLGYEPITDFGAGIERTLRDEGLIGPAERRA
jgi:UDP-glucose 4-epimerase